MINNKLPLIDLHRHLDGNIRPRSIWELAHENNIALPVKQFEQFIPYVQIQHSEANLIDFLKRLDWGVNVLSTLDNCKRIAFENVEDAYNAGINYAELRFSPLYMAKAHNLPVADVVAAVIDGVKQGVAQYNIRINLIGILSRTFGVENCQIELNALLTHKQHLVAVDLAGDEYNFSGELFVDHFKQVDQAGLQVTIHAGEAAGSESVWQAIKQLNAKRIGHGVACATDQALMDYMAEHQIAIESCLTSNFQTGTVSDLSQHPIHTFLANDLLVCLNTDDPAVENTELPAEFEIARNVVNLSEQHIQQLQLNALRASFLSDSEKLTLKNNALTQ